MENNHFDLPEARNDDACPSCDEDIAQRLMLTFREALSRCDEQRCNCPCHRE